ncbi:MAG TPA: butyrate kinase [Clostridiaceae bacterium]|jgi:butyrate kinase|nr:butyrate kinase [Clostridiaceae bacterium]HBG39472.1 butyrate kinase [Clostridiaceae bacterium]HBN28187.1 butyrate kinase [Clostridiaceae bacterium]HBX47903.1 butyrate kinase [Clostridiaceae bacterium]HCL50535.1 butyrate kinase [Clostridiaceae bacterium]
MKKYILAINPGSTSTKVAIFEGKNKILQQNLSHPKEKLSKYDKIPDQYEYRKDVILKWLKEKNIELNELEAVVARGGLLRPMPAGTYAVTELMIKDLKVGIQGQHASNLGGIIAKSIGDSQGIPSFIVDPVSVDEFEDVARISGCPEIPRKSLVHSLNIRAVARKVAAKMGKNFEDINLIVAHLGGGISVAPLRKGRIVDVNNASEEGPFSPERAGGVPAQELLELAYSGKYSYKELKRKLMGNGGLSGYLGTNDAREVEKRIEEGDAKAKLVFDAMAYQIGEEIGKYSAVLCGDVDRIILTGGLAYSKRITDYVTKMVKFIAPVEIVPGEDEMQALAEGAYRVLNGEEKSRIYDDEVKL